MPPHINIELLQNNYVITVQIRLLNLFTSFNVFLNFLNYYFSSLQVYIHMLQSYCTLENIMGVRMETLLIQQTEKSNKF